jgi:hypothetical protein
MDWPAGAPTFYRGKMHVFGDTKGHCASQGGLRGHSRGREYPWSVVGGGNGKWTCVDLLTGETRGTAGTYTSAERHARAAKQEA